MDGGGAVELDVELDGGGMDVALNGGGAVELDVELDADLAGSGCPGTFEPK